MNKENMKTLNKEDDSMSALSEYLEKNKEKAYAVATANTKYNDQGRPVVSKDDEWVNETEWDDLFKDLIRKR